MRKKQTKTEQTPGEISQSKRQTPDRTLGLPYMEGPGVAEVSIPEIDAARDDYRSVRDERMALTEREIELREILCRVMHRHEKELTQTLDGLVYRSDDLQVVLQPSEKVSVRSVHDDAKKDTSKKE